MEGQQDLGLDRTVPLDFPTGNEPSSRFFAGGGGEDERCEIFLCAIYIYGRAVPQQQRGRHYYCYCCRWVFGVGCGGLGAGGSKGSGRAVIVVPFARSPKGDLTCGCVSETGLSRTAHARRIKVKGDEAIGSGSQADGTAGQYLLWANLNFSRYIDFDVMRTCAGKIEA